MKGIYHAKIAPPRIHAVVPRQRLFDLLDSLSDFPVTWISSPAGSGKTTLIASYLRERGLPALWYRVDEADKDLASLFYYITEAAQGMQKGRKVGLPLFTQEYRFGISAFTRHYFETLFRQMTPPGALVFDDYQDMPETAEFHEIVKNGVKVAPEGLRVLIASRNEPPAPFVSLKADRVLASLTWDDLQLTFDEVRQIVAQVGREAISEPEARRIHEATKGWAAAVILMMDEGGMVPLETQSIGQSSVFSYFAIEVFRKLDRRIKGFLCSTALVPSVSSEVACKLTGIEESKSILTFLARNHYFTDRHGTEYSYHPLFREFLLEEARKTLKPGELASMRANAAHQLARAGRVEEAVRLLFDADAPGEALPLVLGHAPGLLAKGRAATLEEWAERLPEEMRRVPWLAYWRAVGRLATDSSESRRLFEEAFSLFEAEGDLAGSLLAASGVINSIALEWDDYRPVDRWIEWIEKNTDPAVPMPTPEIEAQVAAAMVLGLTRRIPWHPSMKAWIDRALEASRQVADESIRCTVKAHVIDHYGLTGDWQEMRLVAAELRQLSSSSRASPLVHLAYLYRVIETHDFMKATWEDAYARLEKAISLAGEIGASLHFGIIYLHGIWISFEMENRRLAADFILRMEQTATMRRRLGRMFCGELKAFLRMQEGDLEGARECATAAVNESVQACVPLHEAYCRLTLSFVLRRLGLKRETRSELEKVGEIAKPIGVTHMLYLLRLNQASLCLDEGDREGAHGALREAFRIGREKGYAITLFKYWQPDEMARLCKTALEAGIEVRYAAELVARHRLIPDADAIDELSDWPWPVRLRTLGTFEIAAGEPIDRKVGRPLDLLKVLISLGAEEVRQESIEDELWPQAEGDMARIAFKTTLSRLRKSIGEKAIEVREGKVSLNRRIVWLDLWAFESLALRVSGLAKVEAPSRRPEEIERLASALLDTYRGDFLPSTDAPFAEPARKRLAGRFARTVERLGQMLIEAGLQDKAADFRESAAGLG